MLSDPLSPKACPSIVTFLAHSNKDILSGLKDGNLLMCGGRVDLLSTPDGVGLGGQVRGVVRRQRWEGRWKGSELHRRVPRNQGDVGAVTRWLLCSEAKEHAAEWVGADARCSAVRASCGVKSYECSYGCKPGWEPLLTVQP